MAGERRRFRANALHQASVSAYGIDVVIEDGKIRLVVPHSEPALRDCHTDAGRNALSERTGGRLHAGYQVVFGMPWRMTPKLPKAPDIVKGDGRPAQCFVLRIHGLRVRKVKHRPQQHRRVAVRQHEAVATRPDRILRIKTHDSVPERINKRRKRHWRAGMAGVRGLHRVDRQCADGVDRELVEFGVCHG